MRQIVRNQGDLQKAFGLLNAFVRKHDYPFELQANLSRGKSLPQLGLVFGIWQKEVSEHFGESVVDLRKQWKKDFLVPIYMSYQAGPFKAVQEQWLELMFMYQEAGDEEKLIKQRNRISLKWASVTQMSDYMTSIKNHYAAHGFILTEPSK